MFLLPNMITNQLILRLGGFFQVPCEIHRLIKMQAVLIFLFSLHILNLHEKFMVHNGHSKLAWIFLTQSILILCCFKRAEINLINLCIWLEKSACIFNGRSDHSHKFLTIFNMRSPCQSQGDHAFLLWEGCMINRLRKLNNSPYSLDD